MSRAESVEVRFRNLAGNKKHDRPLKVVVTCMFIKCDHGAANYGETACDEMRRLVEGPLLVCLLSVQLDDLCGIHTSSVWFVCGRLQYNHHLSIS